MSSEQTPYTVLKISAKDGPLAQIWLAANMATIPKGSILQTNITESAKEIAKVSGCSSSKTDVEDHHITLRTSGELLQGIVRVYSKKAGFLLSDIKDTLTKISSLFKLNQRNQFKITINNNLNTIARLDQLILEDVVTERDVLITPGLEFLNDVDSTNFLHNNHGVNGAAYDDSMSRKVTGAAPLGNGMDPWDTSLEVGRRFNPDEDLEFQHVSGLDLDLDLDFDLDDDGSGNQNQKSKSWNEGTHESSLNKHHNVNNNDDLDIIQTAANDEDNNLPDMDWDLGINENDDRNNADQLLSPQNSEHGSDASVELGRRADGTLNDEPTTDFGFELDIEKESPSLDDTNEQEQQEQSIEQIEKPKQPRKARDPALNNTGKITFDNDTEIDYKENMNNTGLITLNEGNNLQIIGNSLEKDKFSQKRLWSEMATHLSYLPSTITDKLLSYQNIKKQRLHFVDEQHQSQQEDQEENEDMVEPQINMSLGLQDDLINDTGSETDIQLPTRSDDNFIGLQDDILPNDYVQDNDLENEDHRLPLQSQKIQLTTGEVVSRATVDMAELLRTQYVDSDVVNFKTILEDFHNQKADYNNDDNGDENNDIEPRITKREASKGFFDILSLATSGCIDLDQEETFGEINMTSRAPLFEKFIVS
ncbi:kleisin alpha NDAI_0A08210 [Naumovozyma dairenensis CBS 421]|uniref:Rad21/Rec8-like protein N-terminal domain-containing protein n=1 Tax=Naumovozyma dairenensis (strain ATCC 10597 / BCRC 20456 / CBS 421 / NBRC 0211 / NRRL Y-12639) TaxID=1071378 RepID=G0W587_NAUDC|nr:hypothetical protein NDAI_0A08210 [Naumovozyma dairenensis CBS 421]CCD22975.1 hypothetical protein NDAI_0A08210 [Naumovozyma dairenensis CBS 421]